MRRIARLVIVVGVGALAVAQVAGAAPWRAAVELPVPAEGPSPGPPSVGVAADGRAVVVWERFDDGFAVQRLRADGAFDGPPLVVEAGTFISEVQAGMADDGTVVLVWRRGGIGQAVRYARISPDGTLAGEQEITPAADGGTALRLAVHADGTAVLAWRTDDPSALKARTIGPGGATGEIQILEQTFGFSESARVAIGPQGAVVVWSGPPLAATTRFARLQLSGQLAVAPLTAVESSVEPVVGTAQDGTATLVWTTAGTPGRAQTRRVFLDGGLGSVRDLSFAADDVREPRVAVAPDGTATATWLVLGPPRIGQVRRIGADDVLGEVHRLPGTGNDLYETAVAAPGVGPALIVAGTREQEPPLFRAEGFELDATGPPRPPDLLGPQVDLVVNSHAIDAAPSGAAVTAWRVDDGGGARLFATTLPVPAAPAPPPPPPAPPVEEEPPPPTGVVVAPPNLRSLTLSTRRVILRPGIRPPVIRLGVRLNRAAPLRLAVTRSAPGRRRGAACVAPTPALVRAKARVCARQLPVATLTRAGRAGLNRVAIANLRVGRRTLGPGVYRLRLTAGRAGALSRPLTATLTVVRPGS